jgi:nucleoside-diphosphate-sugar epimerase
MRNVVDACKRHGSALVFFDNVHAYGLVDGVMTEDTPYNPRSRKGEVRARIATMFMDDVRRGELRGMILHAADFYGPGAVLSFTHATVIERLEAKKTPQWLGNTKAVHTFTYTRDAGLTVAMLGNMQTAYGRVCTPLPAKDRSSPK